MNWLAENWSYLLLCAVVLTAFIYAVYTKRANAKEWLKWACLQAQKELGTGTGQAKLRMVYDLFIEKFPWFSTFVSFATFSAWVNEALVWVNKQLATNNDISVAITGKNIGEE
jgi:hypothetical protein